MNMTVVGLVEAIRASLSAAVLPELQSDHARGQLAGVLDILAKLERMVEWSPAMLQEQAEPLRAAHRDIGARLQEAGHRPPRLDDRAADDLARLDDGVRALCDWLFDHAAEVPPVLLDELHERLLSALRLSLVSQRNRIPKADFSSMTASTS